MPIFKCPSNRQIALPIAALMVIMVMQTSVHAFGSPSAISVLPACKYAAWKPKPYLPQEAKLLEECDGLLRGIVKAGPSQPKKLASCVPQSASMRDIASVVVSYIERHEARQKERFDILSSLALRHTWPCPH